MTTYREKYEFLVANGYLSKQEDDFTFSLAAVAGLSTRAIAPVFDVSHVQISKDLQSGVNQVNTSTTPVEAVTADA